VSETSGPRPPSRRSREGAARVGGPVCLPSVGCSGYRALGRSRPAPCDADHPVNVHEEVRPAIASSSRASTLDRAPAGPPARPRASSTWSLQTSFCGLAAAYRYLQRMIDARARPRAVNPPPREAPASVRVGGQACACPSAFPVRGRRSVTSFPPCRRFRRARVLRRYPLPFGGKPPPGAGTCARPGFRPAREMTPRSHAV